MLCKKYIIKWLVNCELSITNTKTPSLMEGVFVLLSSPRYELVETSLTTSERRAGERR